MTTQTTPMTRRHARDRSRRLASGLVVAVVLAVLAGISAGTVSAAPESDRVELTAEQAGAIETKTTGHNAGPGVGRSPDDVIPGGFPEVGQLCQLEGGEIWAKWKTCWTMPPNAVRSIVVRLRSDAPYAKFELRNEDGLHATHELESEQSLDVVMRPGDRLDMLRLASWHGYARLSVMKVEGEPTPAPTPAVGMFCFQDSNTTPKPCWSLPRNDQDGLAFSVEANGPHGTAVRYTVKNANDGLSMSGSIPSGHQEALVFRAGDVLLFAPGAGQQLTVVALAPPRRRVDPDWPAPPRIGDYCPTRTDTSGKGILCWRVPPGHDSMAIAVRATSAGYVRFSIRNEIDRLEMIDTIPNGQDKALSMRAGDVLRILTNMPGEELYVVAAQL